MDLIVRQMELEELHIIIDYFHSASPQDLGRMGVDPDRRPTPADWFQFFKTDRDRPIEKRESLQLIWLEDSQLIGFSTADTITYGEHAKMHLHVINPGNRQKGYGSIGVKLSAAYYIETLQLKRLYCEPNAFNTGPNRTLQKAGFKFQKTYETIPGRLNFHQAVTQWVLDA